ncbi:MAG: SMI1/KNR4 family protein [Flavobacteriales bacterium]|nr:SMI1/KNR4 family protein [Flavobacteriales bacterium]
MKKNIWVNFRVESERKFENIILDKDCYGFQIQKKSKWNQGLKESEIISLENYFGFEFPTDYKEMLKEINGLDTLEISIDPEGEEEDKFVRRFYKYPDDINRVKWLIDEVNYNIEYAKQTLEKAGFNSNQIEGFVPLFGHRVLVVFKNKKLTPVLSVWGNDIILYGDSILKYWCKGIYIEYERIEK